MKSTYKKYIQNKISKNIGLLYKARPFLNKNSLLSFYCFSIHSYINYGSISWVSICKTNLKNINSQQKHVLCIISNKGKFEHTNELFKSNKILNICKLDTSILQWLHIKFKESSNLIYFSLNSKNPFIRIQGNSHI